MTIQSYQMHSLSRWPENEYEGSIHVQLGDQLAEARAFLSVEQWATWRAPSVIVGEICLLRLQPVTRTDEAPGLRRVGRAAYQACGRVVQIIGDHVVLNVGYPLLVDLNPLPTYSEVVHEGEVLCVTGRLEFDDAPEWCNEVNQPGPPG